MQRSYGWFTLLIVAVVLAPLAGVFAGPAVTASAESAAPASTVDDEIIVLTSTGQIRVDDPYTAAGYDPATWDSGTDTGWAMVAGGDFNGDGDDEIVATRSGTIKVFDPIVQSGSQAVAFESTLGSSRAFRLLSTGDFDGDGRDEIVATYTDAASGVYESLRIFDGGTDGTAWSITRTESYNYYWQDMGTGDMNGDGRDDVALVRNPTDNVLLIVYSGPNWATLHEGKYSKPWLALAIGNISSSYSGEEIALTRSKVLGTLDSVIVLRLVGNSMIDLSSSASYKYYPYWGSIAMGDLNGDNDQEVLLLRDPETSNTSLLMLNPSGTSMRKFEQKTGYGSSAYKLVRCGDTDGDGLDEVVILRSDRYRIFRDPHSNDTYTDVNGAYRTSGSVANTPTMAIANIDGRGSVQGPELAVSPTSLAFSLEYGQSTAQKSISVTNSGTSESIAWQAQLTSGSDYFTINHTSGTTPGTIGVNIASTSIVPGTYSGTIRVTATDSAVLGSPKDISVNLTVTGVALSVTPTSLAFEVEWGQASPVQKLNISSSGGSGAFPWLADVIEGSDWLHISAASGTSPSTIDVTADSQAAGIGTHTGTIRIRTTDTQVANSPQYVSVSLTVPDPGFIVTPTAVRVRQKVGDPSTSAQFQVLRQAEPVGWVATAVSLDQATAVMERIQRGEAKVSASGIELDGALMATPDWLSFTPDGGYTPGIVTVTSHATTAGQHQAMILIVALDSSLSNRIQAVTVTANVASTFQYHPQVTIH